MHRNRTSIAAAWRAFWRAFWRDWWREWQLPGSPRRTSLWGQLLGTALFGLGIALAMTVAGVLINGPLTALRRVPEFLGSNLPVTLSISYTIHLLYEVVPVLLGVERVARMSKRQLAVYHASLALVGVPIGWGIGLALLGKDVIGYVVAHASDLRASMLFSLLVSVAIWVWFSARAESAQARQRAAEAQLRLLQGQIEPHFLFNTLANVLSLMDTNTPRARQMLETFIDYLRSSLGQMRHEPHTLGQELDLVQRYLELLQMRMVDRLRFRIEADPALRDLPLPPLLVQPLVENAVHHGLEPKIDGGEVQVRAHVEGSTLRIEVLDDGLGLHAPARPRKGHGVALANIRERIASRYGEHAALDLQALDVEHGPSSPFLCMSHPMTTSLIADDEPHLAHHLRDQLLKLWPGLQVVHVARNGVEAAERIAALQPDVAFLDIQMPGLTGLEVAQGIEGRTRTVFVTAYDDYALQAFEREAVDYVLKPVQAERLARTVDRLRRALDDARDPAQLAAVLRQLMPPAPGSTQRLRYVRASSGDVTHQVDVQDVLFFRADDKYTCVCTAEAEHLIRTPIAELAMQLDPEQFWQVHRSTLINLKHLAGTRRDDASRLFVRMKGHAGELPVSRAYVHLFKAM